MNKLTAVIPVRQGSQRVKNKNFKPFCGKSLLEHKIDMVKKLPVEKIIVNTDSKHAIEIAKKNKIDYFERDEYHASNECTNSEYHEYLANVTNSENIIIAQVTAPLISYETYIEAIDLFYNNKCDSLMSVKEVKEFLWFENKPVNYELNNAPNSQNLPDFFTPTFGIVIVKKESMLKDKNFICGKPFFYKISQEESIDIDTNVDFDFAEFLFKKKNLNKNI